MDALHVLSEIHRQRLDFCIAIESTSLKIDLVLKYSQSRSLIIGFNPVNSNLIIQIITNNLSNEEFLNEEISQPIYKDTKNIFISFQGNICKFSSDNENILILNIPLNLWDARELYISNIEHTSFSTQECAKLFGTDFIRFIIDKYDIKYAGNEVFIDSVTLGNYDANILERQIFYADRLNKILIGIVPKCASTVIKNAFLHIPTEKISVFPEKNSFFQNITNFSYEELFHGDYRAVTCIRNPYNRLLSCFLERINRDTASNNQIEYILTEQNIKFEKNKITFSQFIEALSQIPIQYMELHFKPMHLINHAKLIKYDHIFRVEEMKKSILQYNKKFNKNIQLSNNFRQHSVNADKKIDLYYSKALKKKVREIYLDDFILFNY